MKNITLAIAIATLAYAQTRDSERRLKFEVASIKPADPNAKNASASRDAGKGLSITNVPVRNLITLAWNLRDFQLVGGPGWINTEGYDVVAKAAAEPSDPRANGDSIDQRRLRFDRVRERLRWLLADRFGLVVHHETRDQAVYVLTLAKNGPRLKAVPTPDGPPRKEEGRGHAQGFATPIDMLVATLSNATHRTVVDKTGLTGRYDFVLDWTPDLLGAPADAGSGPTIFTAVQEQLGLRLESGKAPVDMVVIDHVDRPSAN
jgi:uncharacterized protein (TIGR03435 family)